MLQSNVGVRVRPGDLDRNPGHQLRQTRGFSLHWLVTRVSELPVFRVGNQMELLCSVHTDFTEVTHAILTVSVCNACLPAFPVPSVCLVQKTLNFRGLYRGHGTSVAYGSRFYGGTEFSASPPPLLVKRKSTQTCVSVFHGRTNNFQWLYGQDRAASLRGR